jgi:hypothetical protein
MPSLYTFIDSIAFLAAMPAIAGLVLTAAVIVLLQDWRISLGALLAQYVLAGLLLTRLIPAEIAMLEVLVGGLICAILYITARRIGWEKLPASSPVGRWRRRQVTLLGRSVEFPAGWPTGQEQRKGNDLPAGLALRLLAVLLIGLVTYSVSHDYPLPEVPGGVSFASYWLAFNGLLLLMLTEEPLKAGQGLLTLTVGFELFYLAIERNLSLIGLWGGVNLLLALAIAYLAAAHGLRESEGSE